MADADAFLVDETSVVTADGRECFALVGVLRHGSMLRTPKGRVIQTSEEQRFLLPPAVARSELAGTGLVVRRGSRLLIPVDAVEALEDEFVPWRDLTNHPRRWRTQPEPEARTASGRREHWGKARSHPEYWTRLARPPSDRYKADPPSAARVALLRRSMTLAKRSRSNDALEEVAEALADVGLYQEAIGVIDTMRPSGDDGYNFSLAIEKHLRDRDRANAVGEDVLERWERRVREQPRDTGWSFRSGALAYIGLSKLMKGRIEAGIALWNEVEKRDEVDSLLYGLAEDVARWGWADEALYFAELIERSADRARAFVEISQWLD